MSGAPARGTVPRRQRRHHHHHHDHHHHHQKHQKRVRDKTSRDRALDEPEEKRPKVNPIFLWASQREQRIVEVRCEDYDKRNRIKLTKTAQGWRSIPRTTSNVYTIALGTACKRTTSGPVESSPASSVSSNDEKENGKRHQEVAPTNAMAGSHRRHPRKYTANGATNGLLPGEGAGRKRRYDEETSRRGYSYLGSKWNPGGPSCSDEDNDNEGEEKSGEEEKNRERSKVEDRLSSLRSKDRLGGRVNLERLQKDKLFQPRVVLEQLHLSQLPESAHQNVVRHSRAKDAANETKRMEESNEQNEKDAVEEEEEAEEEEEDSGKPSRVNKAGIQDILNMIDATASPVLATDTPSADLPVDSTKTYEVLGEKQFVERQVKDVKSDCAKDRSKRTSAPSYQAEIIDQNEEIDDNLEVHEEKILEEDCCLKEMLDRKIRGENKLVLLSSQGKRNPEMTLNSCKVAEADGGLVERSTCKSNSLVTWPRIPADEETPAEAEEEAPDEPGEPAKIDYNDSSKILDALRNTPGLSVSVTRNHIPEIDKNLIVSPARPPSKASSSSRSPDSQAECVEKLLKNSSDFVNDPGGRMNSPRNLPGLSIIIPSYCYRSASGQLTTTTSPSMKRRVESPESTVSFNKADTYPERLKLDRFPHEEDEEEDEDEDDCDSQVLEDLRRQKADSLAHDTVDADYYSKPGSRIFNREDRKSSLDNIKSDSHWMGSSRSNEAQAKCKYQDLEHFDEQVLEELRSRGTVVSPQPSGIPCSPASRRPSSAYLERLLPSPPCSVSCSEDAKSELTLKSILASSNCAEPRDYERSKEGLSTRFDQSIEPVSRSVHSSVDRSTRRTGNQRSFQERLNVHSQETRNSGRPMSSGDIPSTFYTMTDRVALKRPMSVEWQSSGQRQKAHQIGYQKIAAKTKNLADRQTQNQVACATSSSTDKLLDPASQLRELIETVGYLIPDPLLVPRDYLPGLAAAPATEIPKLLASRPELRLPEALTRPDLIRDPDLLVISLAHLQHVLDHGEGPVSRAQPQQSRAVNSINGIVNKGSSGHVNNNGARGGGPSRPKLSCKPIGTLMPTQPIDLSSGANRSRNPHPPLLRVRSGLLKQEPEVSSTATSPDESQLWHPLFGSQKRQQQQQQQPLPPQQQQHSSWHRTTLAS
ncbi:uncharacterized protein LOC105255444 [Camponotus floridanus]|uniref:uncharacterized protein LOC105255444 n=1 Tax=Camponotus floridanus TaxID=104421 RepID=UPI00059BA707|nr:uncharacterized protein LOC105255444 [Camponotus floridanus]